MSIFNKHLRRVALALFVGVTLAAAQVWWSPELRIARGRTISPEEFCESAGKTIGIDKFARLRNLTVYPAATAADGRIMQYVVGEVCVKLPRIPYTYEPFTFYADVPFKPVAAGTATPHSYSTVLQFISERAANVRHGELKFRYAWWASPRTIFALWIGSCVLVIGVMIPSFIAAGKALAAAATVKRRRSPRQHQVAQVSIVDAAETDASATQPEQPQSVPAPVAIHAPAEQSGPPPAPLQSVPLEAPAVAQPQLEHHYRGEFYPVDLPESPGKG